MASSSDFDHAKKSSNVVNTFLNVLSKDETNLGDTTPAEELIRGIAFDEFKEKVSCKLLRGIRTDAFQKIVENLAARFGIPDDLKSSIILDSLNSQQNKEMIKEFSFTKGEGGTFTFARVATVQHEDSIDMAYSIYVLNFKISPKVIQHSKKEKFLRLIPIGEKIWYVSEERNFSQSEKNDFEMYSLKKALECFKREYLDLADEEDNTRSTNVN